MRRPGLQTLRRLTFVACACLVVGVPAASSADSPKGNNGIQFKVLVFTKGGDRNVTNPGVNALRALGNDLRFTIEVTDDERKFDQPHLKQFRAVVFLNTEGDVLDDEEQAAFEAYFHDGGGFLGVGSAVETEPGWQFFTDLLGARAGGRTDVQAGTIKVADRGHDASKQLPEYWTRSDRWYNFATNVRGVSHVLATVSEAPFDKQPAGQTGISGGTMGADHPIAWCKDYKGGRSFYTALGNTPSSFAEQELRAHLGGAVLWAAGVSDPVYSDCGATVLANYQQTKISAPPNLNEPIGFDVLPDGRVIQTARGGQLRLHDPNSEQEIVLATIPVYTNSEDGLYGPAVDNDFESNHWVYLYYAPPTVHITKSDGTEADVTTPGGSAPTTASGDPNATGPKATVWSDTWAGYFQLSRFKLVEEPAPHLDLSTEQKILQVANNRGACCHVAGDIDFDRHGNLWLVTGDDTPAGGGNSGGFGPFNDQLANPTAACPAPCYNAPFVDARRSALNTNDLRGKILRIHVEDDGTYTIPNGNLFAPGTPKTRPEIYAMGFRNPFRIQVDENDVAYITDYSPDSNTPTQFRGPAGTGRVEIVRKPANYGWPLCYKTDLPYYRWNFVTSTPLDTPAQPHECGNPAQGPQNNSRWNLNGGPTVRAGLEYAPQITNPDVWYSYLDNRATSPLGTPCFAYYGPSPLGTCPQLFPEITGSSGVGPHGAAKYHFDPVNPDTTKLPPYYDGAVFFGEFTRDYLREIRLDGQNRVFKINDLFSCGQAVIKTSFPFECDNPMDLQFDGSGHFYLLTYGDGFFAANADAGLYRWDYVKGLRAPRAVLGATPTNGVEPLTVQFSSEGSNDPDPADSIRFAWDFDGNGTVDSIDPNPAYTYTVRGQFTAKLIVTDSSGKTDSKSTVITVGNTAPTIAIDMPVDGGFFDWGQNVPFSVTVTDPQDGAIDCSRVEVTFVLVHDTHGHAEENVNGCSGVLHTHVEDASHGGYLAGGISVSYTDLGSEGVPPLTTVKQHVVQLKRHEVEFAQAESGTTVANTGDVGGGQQRGSLDPGDFVALNNNVNLLNMNQQLTFRFAGGSAATVGQSRAAVEVHLDAADGPIATTATLVATSGNNSWSSQTFSLALTGSHRLYLVFRNVTGGPATNFGNLNWVGFTGSGIGIAP